MSPPKKRMMRAPSPVSQRPVASQTTAAAAATSSLEMFTRHLLPLGIVFLFFAAFRMVQAPIADIDAYYHIKMSLMIRQHGIMHTFPWLQFTIMNKPYVDMHFLYHLINVPFTFLDLETAAKVVGALWAICAFVVFHILLARLRVPYAGLWTLALLAVSWNFIYRMNISRVPAASVAIQMLALIAFYEKRFRMLAGVTFAFVWLYQLFVILLPIAVIFTVIEYFHTRKIEWRFVVYAGAAMLAGMIINPYFPADFKFFYQHVFLAALNPAGIPQGREWLPFESTYFVQCCWGAFGALVIALFIGLSSGTKISSQAQIALLLSGMLLVAYIRSRRFNEYFVPYAMLAAAVVTRDIVSGGGFRTWDPLSRKAGWLAVAGVIVIGGVVDWNKGLAELQRHITPARYRNASAYIAQHSQPGDVVFSADWDDFPELFFHNTKNYYILGLDPNLLYYADKHKYSVWNSISTGQASMPSLPLAQEFQAKYALSDYMHPAFIATAARDAGLALCFQDSGTLVWRVDPTVRAGERLEAEALTPIAAAQPATLQWQVQNFTQLFGGPASKDRTVFVQTKAVGDYVEFAVPATRDGQYDVRIGYVTAADMGIVQWSANGVACGDPVDAYSTNPHAAGLLDLGRLHLRQGENRFRAAITGQNSKAIGRRLAVDYFQLKQLEADAATSGTATDG